MQIYAACLASYNAGRLYGAWITPSSDPDAIREEIAAMLAGSPTEGAEEYAIHDYDGFPNLGEYPDLDDVAAIAALFEEFDHIDAGDLRAIMDNWRNADDTAENLRDNFAGIYATWREYADEAADEMLAAHGVKEDSPLARYFDYEAFARDLAFDMTVIDCPSGVAVFHA